MDDAMRITTMYSDIFCKVYNEFGWNYYPEIFGQQLIKWMAQRSFQPKTAMDLACGTGILCRILTGQGIASSGMDLSTGMIDIARRSNPGILFTVADMTSFCPEAQYDLVTCTGDAINHVGLLSDVEAIFHNVHAFTAPGGWFVFDLLNEREVSTSEPFEMDFDDTTRVWFQMTRPAWNQVNLCIRVYESGVLQLEENIRETIHDPVTICRALEAAGFRVARLADTLPEGEVSHGTTWFIAAQKIE